ncbi:MAG: zinc ribbon domain-containing protein, partial [bacterium]|nr:zinc ribbon domain-containing protein [bacterium]
SFDEKAMEKAMGQLAREAERLDENDPRQAAALMRKLSDATGLKMGAAMEEALNRMEKGEDPDQIEAELGDLLEEEEPFLMDQKNRGRSGRPAPKVDETLYDL